MNQELPFRGHDSGTYGMNQNRKVVAAKGLQ
jgi:hypothetical protein